MAELSADLNDSCPMPVIAIAGRSNTGKSTLFNRLIGKRKAIVAEEAGVTRDLNEAIGTLWGEHFCFVDTGGVEESQTSRFSKRLWESLKGFLAEIDLILFCIDGREGVSEEDKYFAQWLRKQKKPYLLVANKVEGERARLFAYSAYELGMGDPIMVSAEHGEGIENLAQAIIEHFKAHPLASAQHGGYAHHLSEEKPRRVIIAGRPNTGKSTLLNMLVGQQRVLTGDEAGVTRDPIAIEVDYQGQKFSFTDTAGLRRKARINAYVEKRSVGGTLDAIKMAEIVILVIDASVALTEQDLQIARHIEEEGRGCLIILNKWDLVERPKQRQKELLERLYTSFAQMRGMPVMVMSALRRKSVMQIFPVLEEIYDSWNRRIETSALNRWFEAATQELRPPLVNGQLIKLRYITQVKTRPPSFAMFGTRVDAIPRSYMRYLMNSLKESFSLEATPIRLYKRQRANPYHRK